jgi:hypothetical protein
MIYTRRKTSVEGYKFTEDDKDRIYAWANRVGKHVVDTGWAGVPYNSPPTILINDTVCKLGDYIIKNDEGQLLVMSDKVFVDSGYVEDTPTTSLSFIDAGYESLILAINMIHGITTIASHAGRGESPAYVKFIADSPNDIFVLIKALTDGPSDGWCITLKDKESSNGHLIYTLTTVNAHSIFLATPLCVAKNILRVLRTKELSPSPFIIKEASLFDVSAKLRNINIDIIGVLRETQSEMAKNG